MYLRKEMNWLKFERIFWNHVAKNVDFMTAFRKLFSLEKSRLMHLLYLKIETEPPHGEYIVNCLLLLSPLSPCRSHSKKSTAKMWGNTNDAQHLGFDLARLSFVR